MPLLPGTHELKALVERFNAMAERVESHTEDLAREVRRATEEAQRKERALIVGDKSTFGKGTVQTILEIGRVTSLLGNRSQEDGALKLTIQKFYRVAGGSTQLHGVESDIVLPSLSDLPEFGEGALKNCLPYDEVPKANR